MRRLACIALCVVACSTEPPTLLPPPFGPDAANPQKARLFWPTGIAVDGSGKWLLVANGNFDHAYDFGAVYVLPVAVLANLDERTHGNVPFDFDPSWIPAGGAAVVGNYSGPLVFDSAGTTAYTGARDTSRLHGVTVDANGAFSCRTGLSTAPGPDCRNGVLDLKKLDDLEGPYGIAVGTVIPVGGNALVPALFVSALIPHVDEISSGVAFTSDPVVGLAEADPTQLLFSALATDRVNGAGIGAGPIVFDDQRRQLILGGCYTRFPNVTQAGDPSSGKCLTGSGNSLLRFVDVDGGSASASRIYDMGPQLFSNDYEGLALADPSPTASSRTLYLTARNPDIFAQIELPFDPSLAPFARRIDVLPGSPGAILRIRRPAGSPGPDLLAVAAGLLPPNELPGQQNATVQIVQPNAGAVAVAQVGGLGDTAFALAQVPPQPGDIAARLFVSVFGSCRIAVVDVPYDAPWTATLRARIGSCP
jgi:hypothetical protein